MGESEIDTHTHARRGRQNEKDRKGKKEGDKGGERGKF